MTVDKEIGSGVSAAREGRCETLMTVDKEIGSGVSTTREGRCETLMTVDKEIESGVSTTREVLWVWVDWASSRREASPTVNP